MINTLLFDIDGVLIQYKKQFVETLDSSLYKNPLVTISGFYNGKINEDCDRGCKDPIKEIETFIRKIGWTGTSKEYLLNQYIFESQYIDYELLARINSIRKNGKKCYVASNQNPFRKAFLIDKMEMQSVFDNAFFSCDFGFVKPENQYWECVYEKLCNENNELSRNEILFLDDSKKNIESARKFGITAVHVTTKEEIDKALQEYEIE